MFCLQMYNTNFESGFYEKKNGHSILHNIRVLEISRTNVRNILDIKTHVRYNANIDSKHTFRREYIMNKLFNFISDKKIAIIITIITISILYVSVTHMDAAEADATNASSKFYTCITVESGDSLWDIAEEYKTDEYTSTQEYIDEVVSINNLKDESSIVSGTDLLVPYYKVTDLK